MRLPPATPGEDLKVRERSVPFSYWPTHQGTRREGLQSTLFSTDPWFLIRGTLSEISDEQSKSQAAAFLSQSRDFYHAALSSDVSAAKPLLLYYSFLNLAKCLVVRRTGTYLGRVRHGLVERLPTTSGAIHGSVVVQGNPAENAFLLLATALGQPWTAGANVEVRSQDFLAQILIGHRVWCQGDSIKERFVSLYDLSYRYDGNLRRLWLRARLFLDDLKRLDYSQTSVIAALNRSGIWANVATAEQISGRRLVEAESQALGYPNRPSEGLAAVSRAAKGSLWRSVTAYPPYRKYYVYLASPTQTVMSQLLSMYLATYYYGSITRYKPEAFANILDSSIGPFVYEFFANQPSQFLYLMASEFTEQEVARAAVT